MENVVMRQYHVKLQLCGVQQCGSQQQQRRLLRRQLGEGGAGENHFDDYHNRVKLSLKKKWKMLSWDDIVSNSSFVECSSAGADNNDAASSDANLEKEEQEKTVSTTITIG